MADDRRFESAYQRYERYLSSLGDELFELVPSRLLNLDVGDAIIQVFKISKDQAELEIISGDLSKGYFLNKVHYESAQISIPRRIGNAMNDRRTSIVCHEFLYDYSKGYCEHNILFDPVGELSVKFSSASITREPLPYRRLDYFGDVVLTE